VTDITWSLAILAISFLIFFAVLRRVLFVPILKILQERERHVGQLLHEAQAIRENAAELEEDAHQRLQAAREEAESILKEADRLLGRRQAEILGQAREEAQRALQEAGEEIKREAEIASQALRAEILDLTCLAAEAVLQRPLKPEDEDSLRRKVGAEIGGTTGD